MRILSSGAIWATDVWFLNDTTEATYGRKAISRFLDSVASPRNGDREHATALALNELIVNEALFSRSSSYVACFSEERDDLNQWRAYSGGGGYALGFDTEALRTLCDVQPGVTFQLRQVIYDQDKQGETLQKAYDDSLGAHRPESGDPGCANLWPANVAADVLAELSRTLPALKHSAFEKENEWRLQAYHLPKDAGASVKFRATANGPAPYLDFNLMLGSDLPLREVIIGPSRDLDVTKHAIEMLLRRLGMEDLVDDVYPSKVPLRA
ncbi:MAG: DUF2971 domain-containing protein [Acidimicrobiales bacterium]|jgi:hypothetical protein